jgi:hypothetical protein
MLKEAIEKAKENPDSPFAVELRKRIETGAMNDIASQEGLDFSKFVTKESVAAKQPEQKPTSLYGKIVQGAGKVTKPIASFLGMEKFGQGIGQAVSNISGTQDRLIEDQEIALKITNDLISKIKENKAVGKDTSRLEKALNAQLMANKEMGFQIEDVGTSGLTNREVIGSAVQTASMFIPGAPKGSNLLTKAAVGGATGYAMDVGSKLQNNELTMGEAFTPGVGTAIGVALPVVGTILGKAFKGVSKGLEKQNLRLTPNEKRLLGGKVDDVVKFNQKNNLIGSPEQRFSKVSSVIDDFERQVEKKVAGQKTTFIKDQLKQQLENIKGSYADDLAEAPAVSNKIDSIIKQMDAVSGDSISASRLNKWKRNLWKAAFNPNNGQVVNDALYEAGDVFKTTLDKSIKGLNAINAEYGIALASKRILHKATSRAQVGLIGKLAESAIGAGVGTAIGGPVGGLVGAGVAPTLVSNLATPIRSTVSMGLKGVMNIIDKIPVDKIGNLQITKKALINLLQNTNKD